MKGFRSEMGKQLHLSSISHWHAPHPSLHPPSPLLPLAHLRVLWSGRLDFQLLPDHSANRSKIVHYIYASWGLGTNCLCFNLPNCNLQLVRSSSGDPMAFRGKELARIVWIRYQPDYSSTFSRNLLFQARTDPRQSFSFPDGLLKSYQQIPIRVRIDYTTLRQPPRRALVAPVLRLFCLRRPLARESWDFEMDELGRRLHTCVHVRFRDPSMR